jgi:hypothetical protein
VNVLSAQTTNANFQSIAALLGDNANWWPCGQSCVMSKLIAACLLNAHNIQRTAHLTPCHDDYLRSQIAYLR